MKLRTGEATTAIGAHSRRAGIGQGSGNPAHRAAARGVIDVAR